jgi:hypothetical protein
MYFSLLLLCILISKLGLISINGVFQELKKYNVKLKSSTAYGIVPCAATDDKFPQQTKQHDQKPTFTH